MVKIFHEHSKKPSGGKRSGLMAKLLLSLFIICLSFSTIQATELKLIGKPYPAEVNRLILTVPAKIIQVHRTLGVISYTIWLNNNPITVINRFKEGNSPKGILPPGEYFLLTNGGTVTIHLETDFQAFNITLWGRTNAIVEPLWDGNKVILFAPTAIAEAFYKGTKGMGISRITPFPRIERYRERSILYFFSPHYIQSAKHPEPSVYGEGIYLGKTLVGQILPPGAYRLVPERGTGDGIVNGNIVLKFPGNVPPLSERLVSGAYRVETWCPTAYSSTWQLQIVNGRITGTSKWTCCPGPRNDPLTGHIDGNAVTITRDCTGQGLSGPCSQIYSGKLNGDVIEGSFTLNERQNFGTWKLFLNSKDDPSLTLQDPTDGRRNNRKHPADGGLHPGSETAAPEKSHT